MFEDDPLHVGDELRNLGSAFGHTVGLEVAVVGATYFAEGVGTQEQFDIG